MPIPKPRKRERRKRFMSRCLRNKYIKREFKDVKQRFAVCATSWREVRGVESFPKK